MTLQAAESLLVVVDMQPAFLAAIHDADRVRRRVLFLVQAAGLLGVPVIHTVQNPDRMGGSDPEIQAAIGSEPISKMAFSCWGSEEFRSAVDRFGRADVVLCGIESHICVAQTALHMMEEEYDIALAADAISARTPAMHEIGISRLRDAGAMVSHTESCAYEWMHSAENPAFRDVLALVKAAAG
jgi:nicotinamidase-related amidase